MIEVDVRPWEALAFRMPSESLVLRVSIADSAVRRSRSNDYFRG
jgi:hypothetical protein